MSTTSHGGPAFPQDYEHTKVVIQMQQTGEITAEQLLNYTRQLHGMTLRDYFAAEAMQGELSASVCTDEKSDYGIPLNVSDENLDRMTRHWFRIADSMLRARGGNMTCHTLGPKLASQRAIDEQAKTDRQASSSWNLVDLVVIVAAVAIIGLVLAPYAAGYLSHMRG